MKLHHGKLICLFAMALLVLPCALQAQGLDNNEVQFSGRITSVVVNGAAAGTLFVRLDTVDLRVLVNARTTILDKDDDPTTIERLAALARASTTDVEVAGKFSSAGILASSIRVLEPQAANTFELQGRITSMLISGETTLISLLGLRIEVSADTDLLWDGAEIGASDLKIGLFIQVEGTISTDSVWKAQTLKVLSEDRKRESLRFEGTVVSWDSAQGVLVVDVSGATSNQTTVIVTAATEVEGVLATGAYVRVTGTLNASLGVSATEIEVVPLLEIKPDERKLVVGESATFTVKLRTIASDAVTVGISAAPDGVLQLPADPVVIAKGERTADFTVKALVAGFATLTAKIGDATAIAEVTVGEVSGDDDDAEQEVRVSFAPSHIKLSVGESRDVVLVVQPPQKDAVLVTYSVSNDKVEVTGDRAFNNGAAALKVTIRGLAVGTSSVVAELPAALGGGKAELIVEVDAGRGGGGNVDAVGLEFRPTRASMKVGETKPVEIVLARPVADAVRIALRQGGNALEAPSAVEIAAGGQSVTFRVTARSQGHSWLEAELPAGLGGKSARFEAEVRK